MYEPFALSLSKGSVRTKIKTSSGRSNNDSVTPVMPINTDKKVLFFIAQHQLMGRGIGDVNVHLLASARMAGGQLWTRGQET